jgi:predicted phosphoribosyltransferase
MGAMGVAHDNAYNLVRQEVDSIICLHIDRGYSFAAASFYQSFPDMEDRDVISILKRIHQPGEKLGDN